MCVWGVGMPPMSLKGARGRASLPSYQPHMELTILYRSDCTWEPFENDWSCLNSLPHIFISTKSFLFPSCHFPLPWDVFSSYVLMNNRDDWKDTPKHCAAYRLKSQVVLHFLFAVSCCPRTPFAQCFFGALLHSPLCCILSDLLAHLM